MADENPWMKKGKEISKPMVEISEGFFLFVRLLIFALWKKILVCHKNQANILQNRI